VDKEPAPIDADALYRALLRFGPFDLTLGVGMVVSWRLVGLLDLRTGIVIALVRAVLWFAYLHHLLGPIREHQARGSACTDETLLAADTALQHLPRRASLGFGASWVVTDLLAVALAAFDLPFALPNGNAELLAGVLFAASAPGLSTLALLVFESTYAGTREEVGLAVVARALQPYRPPTSLTRPVVAAAVWMLLGAMLAAGGGVVVWSAQIQRQHTLREQQHRIELGLMRMQAGLDPAADGVEVVGRNALPPSIQTMLADAGDEMLAIHDLEHGHAIAAAPLDDGRYLLAVAEPDEQLELVGSVMLIIAVFGAPMFGFAFSLFVRTISAPLERFTSAAQQFVERGDLQGLERIAPVRNDELGRLAASFKAMLDILEQLTSAAAAVSAGDLRVKLGHPGKLHDAFRGMLVRLNEIVVRMRETSLELASAATEINALTQQQEQAALTQSANIQQVAATVSSVATSAQQIAAAADDVRLAAEQALSTSASSVEQIAQLRRHTGSIAELLEVIGDIANRSDLLALNGSLESTRAGEAGRGFALVAAEMRRLAERVTGTVADVRAQVANVEASSASTVLATEKSRQLAQRTAEAARDISKVTAEQSTDTEQASIGVQSVADMVVETTLAMTQTRAAAEGLRAHADALERLIATFEVREQR
jgi:methyl-accepting chemotaxis protein